ncbi:hypothetical protein ACIPL1_24940 [Pseudomonas sp. NPDC090202]|uniref:hypothetical protein n=1 Tax=Pseudomonas sp. NPDC090202 TaxID=3364476 RepID=UPI003825EC5A
MSATQQLIEIDHISDENAPAVYVQNGLKPFLQMIRDEVCGEVPDLTTRKGRERIASLAATVSKRKASVEKPGRDYLRRIKELPKIIEVELREFVDGANALRDEVRKPLTDWEKAEDARVDAHNDGIQRIKDMALFAETPTAALVADVIADLELVSLDDSWQEFLPEAAKSKEQSLATLRALLADRTKHEAELAEIARFNAEKAEREQKEREAQIAREAEDRARREAEAAAQAEREAAIRREQEAKAAAERRELELKLQAEQAERAAAQAKADQIAAEQRAEVERRQAAQRAEQAAEEAKRREIQRQQEEVAEQRRQQAAREADKAHKGAIYKAAKEAFMQNGMTEECARLAVKLVASNLIPAFSIQY